MKPWTKTFDKGNPRNSMWQLCLARDHLYKVWEIWCKTKRPLDENTGLSKSKEQFQVEEEILNHELRQCYRMCEEIDVFVSGYLEGKKEA